nr:hypothetical protein [Chloroflexia bacterium]
DRTQWPTADDLEAGADLLGRVWAAWLAERARQVGGDWTDPHSRQSAHLKAVQEWPAPFPIGRDCMEWDCRPFGALRELMPFDGDEHAAAIIPHVDNGKSIVTFVLAELVDVYTVAVNRPRPPGTVVTGERMELPAQWAYAGAMRQTVNGRARKRCRTWKWVRWLAGHTVREGLPLTDRQGLSVERKKWTPVWLLHELMDYCAAHGPEAPSLKDFLDYLQTRDRHEDYNADDGWKRFKTAYRVTWPELRAMVYAPSHNR